jgi:hypothetical protein
MKNTSKLKKTSWVIRSSFLLFLFSFNLHAQDTLRVDTLYFRDLVKFYQDRCGNVLKGDLYTGKKIVDTPYIYVYVSHREKVENALKNAGYFLACQHSMKKAMHYDSLYSNINDCFIYKTAANASTQISNELLSYRKETQAFIVFHELTHVLLSTLKSKITYTVSESVCDMVGNYLTREYAVAKKTLNLKIVDAQIMSNEHIYNLINSTIMRVEADPKKRDQAYIFMSRELTKILGKGDAYQKARYDHEINNAYLLKNSFYSDSYYFYKNKLVFNRMLPPDLRDVAK